MGIACIRLVLATVMRDARQRGSHAGFPACQSLVGALDNGALRLAGQRAGSSGVVAVAALSP
jgi:hypothetical protein